MLKPANKEIWLILYESLQLNTVVPQSSLSLTAVTVRQKKMDITKNIVLFCLFFGI